MTEVITLQIGQCGNQLGSEFWRQLCDINGLSSNGSSKDPHKSLEVHFEAVSKGRTERFVPRCILVDTKPFDQIPDLFSPDNIICGSNGSGNNWAKGFYNEGFDLIDQVMDATRHAAERTDSFQGFQVFHSLGGGTGSGLGSLVLNRLIEEWPDRMLVTNTVFPSASVSDSVIEPYNAVLSMPHLLQYTHLTQAFDNTAMYNIYAHEHRHHHEGFAAAAANAPTFGDLNALIASAVCSVACSYSGSPSEHGVSLGLRKLATNLIPFPRLHFLTVSNARHVATHHEAYQTFSEQEMLRKSFKASNYMISGYSSASRLHLTNALLLQGHLNLLSVEHELRMMIQHQQHRFAGWIPDQACFSHSCSHQRDKPNQLTMLSNNTGIRHALHELLDQFTVMFRRKSFLWRYYGEGMEELEFAGAQADVEDLLSEYQHFEQYEHEMEQWSEDSLNVGKEQMVIGHHIAEEKEGAQQAHEKETEMA